MASGEFRRELVKTLIIEVSVVAWREGIAARKITQGSSYEQSTF